MGGCLSGFWVSGRFRSHLVPFGTFLHISQGLDEHPKDLPIAKIHIQDAFQLLEVAVVEYPPV